MKKILIVFMAMLALTGCAAPTTILDLSQKSQESVVAYQGNMTKIVMATTAAYRASERSRQMADYEHKLAEMAAKSGQGTVSLAYAKVMALLLINKLDKINDKTRGVEDALIEANIDLDRYLEMQKVVYKYLKESGLQPEHLRTISDSLNNAADSFIEQKRQDNMVKLTAAVSRLETELANPENENKEATLAELEKKRQALELLKGVGGGENK